MKPPDQLRVPPVRVYLCGRTSVEYGEHVLRDASLAGPQGRLLLTYLGTRRTRPASRGEVTEVLWGGTAPDSADGSLNAVVSKLRTALRRAGVPPPHGIATETGSYQWCLPGAWIDVEAARSSLDTAEGALRQSRLADAWADANVAAAIAGQPLLAEERAPWAVRERDALGRVWRRALIVLAEISTLRREYALGIQHAEEALAAEPFDEIACQSLMRAHDAAGNRAEALRVFARCRQLFRDELGADPSEKTTQVFLAILRART